MAVDVFDLMAYCAQDLAFDVHAAPTMFRVDQKACPAYLYRFPYFCGDERMALTGDSLQYSIMRQTERLVHVSGGYYSVR